MTRTSHAWTRGRGTGRPGTPDAADGPGQPGGGGAGGQHAHRLRHRGYRQRRRRGRDQQVVVDQRDAVEVRREAARVERGGRVRVGGAERHHAGGQAGQGERAQQDAALGVRPDAGGQRRVGQRGAGPRRAQRRRAEVPGPAVGRRGRRDVGGRQPRHAGRGVEQHPHRPGPQPAGAVELRRPGGQLVQVDADRDRAADGNAEVGLGRAGRGVGELVDDLGRGSPAGQQERGQRQGGEPGRAESVSQHRSPLSGVRGERRSGQMVVPKRVRKAARSRPLLTSSPLTSNGEPNSAKVPKAARKAARSRPLTTPSPLTSPNRRNSVFVAGSPARTKSPPAMPPPSPSRAPFTLPTCPPNTVSVYRPSARDGLVKNDCSTAPPVKVRVTTVPAPVSSTAAVRLTAAPSPWRVSRKASAAFAGRVTCWSKATWMLDTMDRWAAPPLPLTTTPATFGAVPGLTSMFPNRLCSTEPCEKEEVK